MSAFCATCLDGGPDAALRSDLDDPRRLVLCEACDAGSLRGGRWSFGGGVERETGGRVNIRPAGIQRSGAP